MLDIIMQILQVITILFTYVLLLFIFKYIYNKKTGNINFNKKEKKIDIFFGIFMYIMISQWLFGFFSHIIRPYFAWKWDEFYPYFMDYSDNFSMYVIKLIIALIIIPIICLFVKKKIYNKYKIKTNKYYYILNLLFLDIAYLITTFFCYYIGIVKYNYIII